MNYKQIVLDDLRHYSKRKEALQNMRDRMASLQAQYEAAKTANYGAEPVKGGASQTEERWIDNIMEREQIKVAYSATKRLLALTERGLGSLSERQRELLLHAYDPLLKENWAVLAERMNVSKSEYYRELDAALLDFTRVLCGVVDL